MNYMNHERMYKKCLSLYIIRWHFLSYIDTTSIFTSLVHINFQPIQYKEKNQMFHQDDYEHYSL